MLNDLIAETRSLADPKRAKTFAWFFKTGPDQYGEGDRFLGLNTPQMRAISKKYRSLPLADIQKLIASPYHEQRSIAIQILIYRYSGNPRQIYNFYLKNIRYINNWDLVDISAPKIVGAYLADRPRDILYRLARSKNLWERRMAITSCLYFIVRQGDPADALKISRILLADKHDLIHKAVGWMLREIGKRCSETYLLEFLKANYSTLPRTTLRYSIERFPLGQRQKYLKGDF